MERLGEIYKSYCLNSSNGSMKSDAYDWIPGKILRCFYDKDFRYSAPIAAQNGSGKLIMLVEEENGNNIEVLEVDSFLYYCGKRNMVLATRARV